jgi:hypothetical protein
MSTTPTPAPLTPQQLLEQQYLQSGYSASSGVDAELLAANPATNAPTNAITEQLENLTLPETQSLFEPQDYWDYTNYNSLSQNPAYASIGATNDATGSVASTAVIGSVESSLESFSLFGLGPVESWLIVAGVIYLVASKTKHKGHK